jgi:hypothetical protein
MDEQGGRPIVGEAAVYAAFVRLARARAAELNLTFESLDHLCNFPQRYTATLLSGGKTMSVYSFFTLARALALMPMFGHDEAQLAQLRQRGDWIATRRAGPRYRPRLGGVVRFANYPDFYRQIGKKGARVWNAERKRRKAAARHAALARWGNGGNHPPK